MEKMNIVLEEFKARVANVRAEFKSRSKEEKKELRAIRKSTNEYVEKVTKEWRTEKEEEKKREKQALAEWADLVIDRWDTRKPPSNIFQMEHAAEMPHSKKRWLHA